jgi:hypothetical protein
VDGRNQSERTWGQKKGQAAGNAWARLDEMIATRPMAQLGALGLHAIQPKFWRLCTQSFLRSVWNSAMIAVLSLIYG